MRAMMNFFGTRRGQNFNGQRGFNFPQRRLQSQAMPLQYDPMITFEPLDAEAVNQLKLIQGGKASTQEGTAYEKQVVVARDDVDVIAAIEKFIQNERNASLYYAKLAEKAPDDFRKNILTHIAENSRKNAGIYGSIYKEYKGAEFETKEEEIEAEINFTAGIRLAIREENTMLNELTTVYDMVRNDRVIHLLQSALQKKHSTISNLFSMNMG